LLGNPYQTVVDIAGTRIYTYLPTGAQVISNITGLLEPPYEQAIFPDQRFYPYSLLASAPGVYTANTAPFLDADGLGYTFAPGAPSNGLDPNEYTDCYYYCDDGMATVFQQTSLTTAVLTDEIDSTYYYGYVFETPQPAPLIALQQQSLHLLP
jgi:hypothetical protein